MLRSEFVLTDVLCFSRRLAFLACVKTPFLLHYQGAFLGREVSVKVDVRHFYREASPDYARWISRKLFKILRPERIPGLRRSPTAHNPVLRMIAVEPKSAPLKIQCLNVAREQLVPTTVTMEDSRRRCPGVTATMAYRLG